MKFDARRVHPNAPSGGLTDYRTKLFLTVLVAVNAAIAAFSMSIYLFSGRSLQREAVSLYVVQTRSAAQMIDRVVENALFQLLSVSLDPDVSHVLGSSFSHESTPAGTVRRVQERLRQIVVQNPAVDSVFIARTDTSFFVISEHGPFTDRNLFIDSDFVSDFALHSQSGAMNQPVIMRRTVPRPIDAFQSTNRDVLTLSVPPNRSHPEGAIVMNLRVDWLQRFVGDATENLSGLTWFEIRQPAPPRSSVRILAGESQDGDGELALSEIESRVGEPGVQVWRRHVVFSHSPSAATTLQHVVRRTDLFALARIVRLLIVVIWIILAASSVPLALAAARLFYRPVNDLFAYLAEGVPAPTRGYTRKDLSAIEREYRLVTDRASLDQRMVAEYKPLHDEVILLKTLLGQLDHVADTSNTIAELHRRIQDSPSWCVVLEIDGYREYSQTYSLSQRSSDLGSIVRAVRDEFDTSLIVSHLIEDRVVFLASGDVVPDEGALAERLIHMRAPIEDYLQTTVTISIGALSKSIEELPVSFRTAQIALEHKFLQGKGHTIWARDVRHDASSDTLKDEQIKKLQQSIRALKRNAAAQELNNCLTSVLPGCYLKQTYTVLSNRILAAIQSLPEAEALPLPPTGDVAEFIVQAETITDLYNWFFALLNRVFRALESARGSRNETNLKRIETLIEEKHADPLLQIADVAEQFRLSATYFGRFFQELTGTTFSSYVNSVRMKHAAAMLMNTDLPVQEIAMRSGFNSTQYFIRVFRRQFRMTPKTYRERHKGQ